MTNRPPFPSTPPAFLIKVLGLFVLCAVAVFVAASWLRAFTPTARPARVRDLSWSRTLQP